MADLKSIIQQLTEERDRIDAAIRALQQVEGSTSGHRTGAARLTSSSARAKAPAKQGKRKISAEGRARIAAAAKARWAAAKKAGKRSL